MAMQGIDISSWQAGLDISQVPCDFVIVKATGGVGYVNPYCDGHVQQARSLGKCWGFYHFAREAGCESTGYEEANYFYNNTKNYFGEGIPILDYEADAINRGPGWALEFLNRIYELSGVKPLIYMSKSVCNSQDWSAVVAAGYGLWFAQYPDYSPTGYRDNPWTDDTGIGAWPFAAMFQYTSSGSLSGWRGRLDLNIFYGDANTWNAYAGKQTGEITDPIPAPPEEQPVPSTQLASPEAIAIDVIKRNWGDGADRIARLKAAGYDPDAIQAEIDAIYSDNNRLAGLVMMNVFGVGDERKQWLGDKYDAVQAIVNKSQ